MRFRSPSTTILFVLLLSFCALEKGVAWFWGDSYYLIETDWDKYYSKGKPITEGKFIVFNKWPENLEWKIKTDEVVTVKEIGQLSPDEIAAIKRDQNEKLRRIFRNISKTNAITKNDLFLARNRNYTDSEIWETLIEDNPAYSIAKDAGLSLDQVAEFFDSLYK